MGMNAIAQTNNQTTIRPKSVYLGRSIAGHSKINLIYSAIRHTKQISIELKIMRKHKRKSYNELRHITKL